ncbi:MAG: heme A synthase [Guyparkeria sp.]
MNRAKQLRFLSLATLLAVLFLIWVGGTVRATGAGMGCPDWPTCFGQVIPPMSEADLPADYQQRWANYGYDQVRFDPVKTWTEYLNRLTGTLIGFLALITLILAFLRRREDGVSAWLAAGAFALVGFNGWLGAMVVETNLHSAVVTTHMLLSFGVILLLMGVVVRTRREQLAWSISDRAMVRPWLIGAMTLTILQTGFGTQVRERVDAIAASAGDFHARGDWLEQVGSVLSVHMALAVLVLAVNLLLWWKLRATSSDFARRGASWLLAALLAQLALGGWLVLGDLPIAGQPLHLLGAALVFTVQGWLLMTPTRQGEVGTAPTSD